MATSRSTALLLALLLVACGGRRPVAMPQPAPAERAPLNDAALAWSHRDQPGELERCIAVLESIGGGSPSPAVSVQLSRAYELQARRAPTLPARLEAYARGIEAAEAALLATGGELASRLKGGAYVEDALEHATPRDTTAIYWYATSLMGYSLARGLTGAVRFQRRIEALYGFVVSRDETFEEAGAHRGLGSYYARAPAVAGGDLARSREHFQRALTLAPRSVENRLTFAEDYAVAAPDRELFTRLLEEVVATDQGADAAGLELARARAKALLARAGQLF